MSELAKRIRAKFPGAYDDIDDAALEKAVLAKHPEYADLAKPDQPAEPEPPKGDLGRFAGVKMLGDAVIGAGKAARDNPVQAGAMLGGLAAAPFTGGASLVAAGLGAAGGAGLGSIANAARGGDNGPKTGGGVLRTMAGSGVAGATGQGIGAGVAGAVKSVVRPVAKGVLRMAPRLQREYDDLLGTFLKERIPVGQSGIAGDRMKASAATARQMAADAEVAGAAPVGPRDIVREFRGVRDDVTDRIANGRPGSDAEMREIVNRAQAIRRSGPQSVTRNQELKQSAQQDASTAFRAQDRGAVINDTTAKLDKAVAIGRQKAAQTRIPGIQAQNKQTQNLMGLEEALEGAQEKSQSPLGFNPINWGGAMFPGTTSKVAFHLDRASRAPFPASFRTALLAALAGDQE